MSEMEQLHQGASIAGAAANEAHNHAASAQELAGRVISAGSSVGFGNDPALVIAAQEQLSLAIGGLSAATSALDDALRLIMQARSR